MHDKKSCHRRDEKCDDNDDGNNKNNRNSSHKRRNNKPKPVDEIKTNTVSVYQKKETKNGGYNNYDTIQNRDRYRRNKKKQ